MRIIIGGAATPAFVGAHFSGESRWRMMQVNNEDYVIEDRTISPKKVNKYTFLWGVGCYFFFFVLFSLIWGVEGFGFEILFPLGVAFIVLIVVHEFLHAAGYVYIGKASWRDVKFGIIWKQFMPYAHCRGPLRINHYRMAVFLPVILGVIPLTYAFFTGSPFLFLIGVFMTLASPGDKKPGIPLNVTPG
ncbi:DUF3267 domain-containing protein [Alteribacter keqinensis]|uniref:DUF3267 domain-containing protein n=1 Tax=Alteribacter keqinensis TaxID=2483800 RepID=A0A3M7TNC7_9BACI|nr:DUF3267 domain-containing protein [Alteribacter keqinensis]RNA67111.1 DUF3267 domain-containing protein [Alteribacter keqinensis]